MPFSKKRFCNRQGAFSPTNQTAAERAFRNSLSKRRRVCLFRKNALQPTGRFFADQSDSHRACLSKFSFKKERTFLFRKNAFATDRALFSPTNRTAAERAFRNSLSKRKRACLFRKKGVLFVFEKAAHVFCAPFSGSGYSLFFVNPLSDFGAICPRKFAFRARRALVLRTF